ncbi:cell division protein ZipA C-terminal FtsZ-binding domain-containing protein [Sulfuritalea sp.]|uniref:cell division protein ZipA C-terminal FtsZ-binding domain-containing protein n=1 Tax=Sulfuritalea sp. TaxID=2480090 RepID=UPI00286E25F9|nr:cell division protein ZipA C-terminal FtsZ-binding domain-containing protein [Sulfuritalea sp.]
MAISELQIALIGAGAVGVAMVWGYNVWQDRQYRKTAERIFNGEQGDALPVAAPELPRAVDDERREPHLDAGPDAVAQGDDDPYPTAAVDLETDEAQAASASASAPPLPEDSADEIADCVLRLTASEAIAAPVVLAMQNAWAGALGKPLHWLARNDDEAWRQLDAQDAERYRDWAVALQLVDRRGAVSAEELTSFFDGAQQIAQHMGAALDLPVFDETLLHAARLDEFCAGVDIQFVLHVVEATGGVFAGTKLRGVAEAAGLVLEADGVFRARDEAGGELFTVANLGNEPLAADTLAALSTHGLTLSLDVPRVADGVAAFGRMLAMARQLTTALGGVLVDAQRAPLSQAMIDAIGAKTAELQQTMRDAGIEPGSVRALRLFS